MFVIYSWFVNTYLLSDTIMKYKFAKIKGVAILTIWIRL